MKKERRKQQSDAAAMQCAKREGAQERCRVECCWRAREREGAKRVCSLNRIALPSSPPSF